MQAAAIKKIQIDGRGQISIHCCQNPGRKKNVCFLEAIKEEAFFSTLLLAIQIDTGACDGDRRRASVCERGREKRFDRRN